jgi:phenylacetate-CoA ligase
MTSRAAHHPPPPFCTWQWQRAWQETWLAGLWPHTARALQQQRLQALLQAAQQSPLYRERLRPGTAWTDVAPVDKPELMQRFDEWSCDRRITRAAAEAFLAHSDNLADAWLDRYVLWTSSGTSGVPGWFVQDAASLAAWDAIDSLRLRGLRPADATWGAGGLGLWGLGQRFAFVGAVGGHFAGVVSMRRLQRTVPPPLRPAIEVLSVLRPLADLAAALQRFAPTVLITYPSMAAALACSGTPLALREVWVGGEQLTAGQRLAIESAFACPVRNSYGASECLSIAWQCSAGRLHMNDDWLLLEPVDERLQPVPAGVLSHTALLTNLANRVQPLIRYRLDDRIRVLDTPCACGSTFTGIEVQGRSGHSLVLPAQQRHGGPVTLVPLALETVIEDDAGVSQFQLIDHRERHGAHRLELRFEPAVVRPTAAFARCREAIERYLHSQHVKALPCSYSAAAPLRDAASGKIRRVVAMPAPPHPHPHR